MQPNRVIHLQYDDLEAQCAQFVEVFRLLQAYEPGIGFDHGIPVLLGFHGQKVVNLEKLIYETFPELKYEYDGNMPIVELKTKNPKIFQ